MSENAFGCAIRLHFGLEYSNRAMLHGELRDVRMSDLDVDGHNHFCYEVASYDDSRYKRNATDNHIHGNNDDYACMCQRMPDNV